MKEVLGLHPEDERSARKGSLGKGGTSVITKEGFRNVFCTLFRTRCERGFRLLLGRVEEATAAGEPKKKEGALLNGETGLKRFRRHATGRRGEVGDCCGGLGPGENLKGQIFVARGGSHLFKKKEGRYEK